MRFTASALTLTFLLLSATVSRADDTDDLFEDAAKAADTGLVKPAAAGAKRKLHSHAEIKAELVARNKALAEQFVTFIDLSKQLARQSLDNEQLMEVFREYGPAVIRMKQRWQAVVGNPAKYDTWLGSPGYLKAWPAFIASWDELYQFTDRFAAVDLDVADKVTDGLTTLGAGFEEYCDLADEWDGKLGNSAHAFARTPSVDGVEEANMPETTTEDAEAPDNLFDPDEAKPVAGEADELEAVKDEAAQKEALEEEAKGEGALDPETSTEDAEPAPDAETESATDTEDPAAPEEKKEESSDDDLFGN